MHQFCLVFGSNRLPISSSPFSISKTSNRQQQQQRCHILVFAVARELGPAASCVRLKGWVPPVVTPLNPGSGPGCLRWLATTPATPEGDGVWGCFSVLPGRAGHGERNEVRGLETPIYRQTPKPGMKLFLNILTKGQSAGGKRK